MECIQEKNASMKATGGNTATSAKRIRSTEHPKTSKMLLKIILLVAFIIYTKLKNDYCRKLKLK
jgi:hypothetical protein